MALLDSLNMWQLLPKKKYNLGQMQNETLLWLKQWLQANNRTASMFIFVK
jgi:hypothetical protein